MPGKLFLLFFYLISWSLFAKTTHKSWTTYASAKTEDGDFMVQGEYGSAKDGLGVQIVALGDGKFDAYFLEGGLPGDGWDRSKKRVKVHGTTTFTGKNIKASVRDNTISLTWNGRSATLKRVERESPTLGQKAPQGAIVLFDGSHAKAWNNGRVENGLLLHGTTSKELFQSYQLHLEFMTPYKPFARGQKRGNSGIYHQGRYETQVLDSFGLEGKWNETGGIYQIARPSINMCFPPLRWQTYDVELTAAVYEGEKKVKNPRITVKLNGVLIHKDVELPRHTASSPVKEGPQPGPIYLQDHKNPVFYRNIWIIKKDLEVKK